MRGRLCAALLALSCSMASPAPDAPPAPPQTWVRTPPPGPLENAPRPAAPHTTSTRLRNGLRVVVVEQHERPTVMLRLAFGLGSATDPQDAIGATHFAVTLLALFHDAEDEDWNPLEGSASFYRKVWEAGGSYDSSVWPDGSEIGIDGLASDVDAYVQMLWKGVSHPRRDPESFTALRGAYIHDLEDVQIQDDLTFFRFLSRAAFGEGHPYARASFGTTKSLKRLGYWQVTARQDELLNPRLATLVVVGDVQPGQVLASVNRTFGRWTPRRTPRRLRVSAPRTPRRPVPLVVPRPYLDAVALCALRPVSDAKESDAALAVLAELVGRPGTGRVYEALRMREGLAYSVFGTVLQQRHARALAICASVPADECTRGLEVFLGALSELREAPPTPEQLAHAKAVLIAEIEYGHDSVQGSAEAWSTALELGRVPDPQGRIAAIEAVTTDEVHALAGRVLDPESLRLLLAGKPYPAERALQSQGFRRIRRASLR